MADAVSDPELRWEDGVPVSSRFEDPYYARSDGLAEARHVFLEGNGLAQRFAGVRTFHIAELGFGTGLNFLAALHLWRERAANGATLCYSSYELCPLDQSDISRAIGRWPELEPLCRELIDHLTGRTPLPDVRLNIWPGDVRQTLSRSTLHADAWFLDGFAPARNPEMWGEDLLHTVARRTSPGGTFATYTAAGHVRRTLQAAGFEVRKVPGYGTKRDMLVGQLRARPPEPG